MKKILVVAAVLVLSAGVLSSLPAVRSIVRLKADSTAFNWDKMSKKERGMYMKDVVSPAMEKEFSKFDSMKFGKMNCATCHGKESVKTHSFKMPSPELPRLPSTPEAFRAKMASKKEMTAFMMNTVKPQMAKLLHEPEFNVQTGTGFGCFDCHTKE